MTLEELKYIVSEAYNKNERYVDIDCLPWQLKEVELGEWIDDGKYSHCSDIYQDDVGNHFEINNSRSGSYHTDYYYNEPDVYQVIPKVETITRVKWVMV